MHDVMTASEDRPIEEGWTGAHAEVAKALNLDSISEDEAPHLYAQLMSFLCYYNAAFHEFFSTDYAPLLPGESAKKAHSSATEKAVKATFPVRVGGMFFEDQKSLRAALELLTNQFPGLGPATPSRVSLVVSAV